MKGWPKNRESNRWYSIQYNDCTSESWGLILQDYPEFSGAENSYNEQNVAGRAGSLVGKNISKSNLVISCTFTVIHSSFMNKVREIRHWMSGNGELILSDSPGIYYKVFKINYGNIEREMRNMGRFTVTFTCSPFEYLVEGKEEHEVPEVLFNAYSVCHPTYMIVGEGVCTLAVNGNKMTANVGQDLTIDTEHMLAYRKDGTLQNTEVTGDYEDMFLKERENAISITDGFNLKVIPNWGYEV